VATPAAPVVAKTSRAEAAKAALKAFRVDQRDGGEVVFATQDPLPVGATVREGGPSGPDAKGDRTDERGITVSPAASIARVRRHRAWFFYDDRAPFQAYEHAGQVALVDLVTGKVTTSRMIDWPPLIGDQLPGFMRDSSAYRDEGNRVFYRPYAADTTQQRARAAIRTDPFGPRLAKAFDDMAESTAVADLLAAEHSCALRFSDTLAGDYYDFGAVDVSRGMLGSLLRRLTELNDGFKSTRYTSETDVSPSRFVRRFIDNNDCEDVLLYLAGGGYRGEGTISIGMRASGDRIYHQDVSQAELKRLIGSYPRLTFKVVVDAPYSGGIESLTELPNVLITAAPGGASRGSFSFLPEVEKAGRLVPNTTNGQGLLEFTNRLLSGLHLVLMDPVEVSYATQLKAQGKIKSVLAWFLARAVDRSVSLDFVGLSGLMPGGGEFSESGSNGAPPPPIQDAPRPVRPFNTPPVADGQSVTVGEDGVTAVTLRGSDPDGNAIAFGVASQPSHGTLAGTPPNLLYTPSPDYNGPDSFAFGVNDGTDVSPLATVSITVGSVNDAPSAVGDARTIDEDHLLTVAAAGVLGNDSDIDGDTLVVSRLQGFDSLTHSTAKGAAVSISPSGGFSYDPRGVVAFELAAGEQTSDSFTYTASDGHGGTSQAVVTITVTGVNDAPVNGIPGAQSVAEDGTLTFSSANGNLVSIGDVDAGSSPIEVVMGVAHGTLSLSSTTGLTFAVGDGTADPEVTLTGTRAAVNTALAGMTLTPAADYTGDTALEIETHDQAGGSDDDAIPIAVSAVNDAPVNSVPGTQTLFEDTDRTFSTATSNAISISDVDAAGSDVEVELTSAQGLLTLPRTTGLDFLQGDGTGDWDMIFTGTIAAINAALDGLVFVADADSDGLGQVWVDTHDRGHTGAGGEGRDVDLIEMEITGINDAPVVTAGSTLAYSENAAAAFIDDEVIVNDVDREDIESATVRVSDNYVNGEDLLSFVNTDTISGSFNAATGTLTLTGSDTGSHYLQALRSVKYANASDDPSTSARTISWTVNDGDLDSATATSTVTVSATDDAPTITTSEGPTIWTGADVPVDSGVIVTDPDSANISGATVQFGAFNPDQDRLTFADVGTIAGAYNPDEGTLTLSGAGTVAEYQAALRSVLYENTEDGPVFPDDREVDFEASNALPSNSATKTITLVPPP
jgi:VCBS repeat-containing protein